MTAEISLNAMCDANIRKNVQSDSEMEFIPLQRREGILKNILRVLTGLTTHIYFANLPTCLPPIITHTAITQVSCQEYIFPPTIHSDAL